MFFPRIRSIALAAAAVVALGAVDAADLTTFPEKYDALTVTSEVQVEALAGAVEATKNDGVGKAFQTFLSEYVNDAADGTLTVDAHNARIDAFLQSANAFVPDFSATGDAAIASVVVDFFKFQKGAYAASWDVLSYGAATAQTQPPNPTIAELLQAADSYMTENISSAKVEDLQAQVDKFIADAEVAVPGYRQVMYDVIGKLYTSLWDQESAKTDEHMESAPAGSTAGSGETGGSTAEDEAGVPSGSGDSTTPTPSVTQDANANDTPSPASTTSSAKATATLSLATVAAMAVAYAAILA